MTTHARLLILGLAGAVAMSPAAFAAQSASGQDKPQAPETMREQSVKKAVEAEKVIGQTVIDPSGTKLGSIEELVVSKSDGQLYAVVAVGGFLGIGDKEVALPFSDLSIGAENVVLMSQKNGATISAMPEFDPAAFESYKPAKKTKEKGTPEQPY